MKKNFNETPNKPKIPEKGKTEPYTKKLPKLQIGFVVFIVLVLVLLFFIWEFNVGNLFS